MRCWLVLGQNHVLLVDESRSFVVLRMAELDDQQPHKSDNEPVTKVLSHPTRLVPLSISSTVKNP